MKIFMPWDMVEMEAGGVEEGVVRDASGHMEMKKTAKE